MSRVQDWDYASPTAQPPVPQTLLSKPAMPDFCLRCVNILGEEPNLVCVKQEGQKVCVRCTLYQAPCLPVPGPFAATGAQLISDAPFAGALKEPADDDAILAWKERCMTFRKLMESYRRANPEEIDPLQGILRQLTRVGNSLEALEDIARWHFRLPTRETEKGLGNGDNECSPTGGSCPDFGFAAADPWFPAGTQRSRTTWTATPPSDSKDCPAWLRR